MHAQVCEKSLNLASSSGQIGITVLIDGALVLYFQWREGMSSFQILPYKP